MVLFEIFEKKTQEKQKRRGKNIDLLICYYLIIYQQTVEGRRKVLFIVDQMIIKFIK